MTDDNLGFGDAFDPTAGDDAETQDGGNGIPDNSARLQPDAGTETVDGVTIDYGVEPPATRLGGRGPKWPWHAVRVGGSIRFDDQKTMSSALNSAKRWAKRQPEPQPVFRGRSMGDGVYRVFRIE